MSLQLRYRRARRGSYPPREPALRNNTPIVTQPIPEVVHTPKQETPQETPQKTDDYEAIRALIQEYERRIDELEQMLPENQVGNNNKQSDSEYVQI